MARVIYPAHEHVTHKADPWATPQQLLGYALFFILLLGALLILMVAQYNHQHDLIEQACAQTGAAAKLDLSSFVPLCKEVTP